jgi:fucose permease
VSTITTNKTSAKIGLIFLAYIAFISLGLPDGLLGVAWPSIRADFGRPLDALGFLLIASMSGNLTSSFVSGQLMARLGVGGLLAASCAATGAALLGYTLVPVWWLMVALGVVAGLGAGAIDAGINTYIAAHHGEGLMQWLHASFGIGVTLGPLIMTAGIAQFDSWRPGYVVVGTAQLTLALCFALTAGLWQRNGATPSSTEERRLTEYQTPLGETLRQPRVWFSLLLFFIYTGTELTLGGWGYTLLTESRGVAPAVAGLWISSYWGMFTIGRVLAGLYARRMGAHTLLRMSILAALAGAVLLWWSPVPLAGLLGVAITGFAIAPIFPALVSGTSQRVGVHHAANTIGMQIGAAGLGATLLPGAAGVLARRISLEVIPVFLVVCILVLLGLYLASTRPNVSGNKVR